MDRARRAETDRLALAIVVGFFIARLLFDYWLGLGVDESYTLAISRRLSLSYFDHPPLHQWIVHFAALALGETFAARLPFIVMFAATGWLYYRLTLGLFGPRAAIVALFALNATPFFFASAGGWIVPDGPLLLALTIATLALAELFFGKPTDARAIWRLWLTAGVGLGLAGLSKYSAALSVAGLAAFVLASRDQRHWLRRPEPYAAAIVGLAIIAPVIMWNAQHHWASFEFQGSRGALGQRLRPEQVLAMALGQVAYLSPWIFAPLVAALASALRRREDERRRFLLCLSLPPIVFFTLTPLWGTRGFPHWAMPGWFFTFALLGAWVAESDIPVRTLRRWAIVSSGLLAAVAGVAVVQASTGWPWVLLSARPGAADPTLETFAWNDLGKAPIFNPAPKFVIATRWMDAGKIALALGPRVPVFVLSNDPRGWAFVDDSGSFIGENGVIVARAADIGPATLAANSYFASLGQPRFFTLGRGGRAEIELVLIPANGLTRRLPMPYPSPPGG